MALFVDSVEDDAGADGVGLCYARGCFRVWVEEWVAVGPVFFSVFVGFGFDEFFSVGVFGWLEFGYVVASDVCVDVSAEFVSGCDGCQDVFHDAVARVS